ncbi:hypothetical protein JCM17823_16980 [Halorubrum gandharaense]
MRLLCWAGLKGAGDSGKTGDVSTATSAASEERSERPASLRAGRRKSQPASAASRNVCRNPRPESPGALEVFIVVLTPPTTYKEPPGDLWVFAAVLTTATAQLTYKVPTGALQVFAVVLPTQSA